MVGAGPLEEEKKPSWKPIVAITAVAMLTCNLHRSVFTMLLPDISAHHLLTLKDVGVMNSAMLGGYLAGQIPAGFLSDMLGGERVLLVGLLLWSLATASTGLMPTRAGLIASRIAMGLFSACAMPATSAMAARWVPPQVKASTLATVYMLFNMGGVLGLVATPFIAQVCGFSSTFMATGLAGALWAVGSWLYLPQNGPESHGLKGRASSSSSIDNTSSSSSSSNGGGSSSSDASNNRGSGSSIGNEGSVAASGLLQASGFGENGASSSNSSDYGQLSGSNGGGGMVSSLGATHIVEGRVGSSDGVSSRNSNSNSSNGSSSSSSSSSSNGSDSNGSSSSSNGSSSSSNNGQGDSSYRQLVSKSFSASGSTNGGAPCPEWNGASSPAQTGAVGVSAATVVETQPSLMQQQQQQQQQQQHLERAFHAEYPGQSLYTNGGGLCTDAHAEQKTSNTPQQALQLQHERLQPQQQQQQQSIGEAQPHSVQPLKPKGPPVLAQILVLCWAHAVMGWGFFIFQSWIPLYLASLGVASPTSTGLLAGMPWLAAGLVGAVAGNLADGFIRRGSARLTVRRGAHAISTLGCAACAIPLAAGWATTPAAATAWLVLFQSCYAFSFGGFHAYVQDVAQASAGKLLGLTNSCSIALGIVGNLCTGVLVESTGSYSVVFLVTIGLYLTSLAAFVGFLQGTPLELA